MISKLSNRAVYINKYVNCLFFGCLLSLLPQISKGQAITQGDFRSTANGDFTTPAAWEKYDGTSWQPAIDAPASAISANIFIQHQISSAGSNFSSVIYIGNGGVFTVDNSFEIGAKLVVGNGGALKINQQLTIAASAIFEVKSGGTTVLNYAYASPATTLWAGTEIFDPNSELIFQKWSATGNPIVPNNAAISSSSSNNFTALFGRLVFDFGPDMSGTTVDVLGSNVNLNLAHGNVEFNNSALATINLATAGSVNSGNGGNFVLSGSFSGKVNFSAGIASGTTANFTINGGLQLFGGIANLHSESTTGVTSTVVLKGNLVISAAAQLLNSNAAGAAGAGSSVSLIFAGTSEQIADVHPSLTNVPFRVNSGSTLKLNRDLTIDGSAMFSIVQTGAILDFNGNIYFGTSTFRQEAGATLRITSSEGISESGATGNVQTSNRAFNSAGIYHYKGTTPQVTGTGLNPASGAKVIIIDNPTVVSLSRTVNISNSNAAGLDIRKGAFEGAADAYLAMPVTNSIFLTMAEATTYRFLVPAASLGTNQLLPQANGIYNLHANSTLEFAAAGDQKMRGTTKVFGNVTFSGSGIKTTSGNVANIEGTVIIKEGVTVDVENSSFGKAITKFTMTGGRFRTARTSGVQPMMGGDYNLSGGVVEFYGSTATSTQSLRGAKEYNSIEITSTAANTSDNNVSLASGSVVIKEEFKIFAPAVFQIGGGSTYITGDGEFVMEPGTTLKYGNANGITLQNCGADPACGNIRTAIRNFPSDASYGFIGTAIMATGNGLPSEIKNLYLQKGNATQRVTLSAPLTVTGEAALTTGILVIENNLLTLAGTLTGVGTGTIRGNATSQLAVSGQGNLGTLYFTSGYQQLGTLLLNRQNGIITLGTPLTIHNSVDFQNGIIKSAVGAELAFALPATFSGPAATANEAASYVSGPVSKIGNSRFRFPVGSDTHFAPIEISAPEKTTDVFTATYFSGNPNTDIGSETELEGRELLESEYWKLDHTGTSKVKVTLTWNSGRSTPVLDNSNLHIAFFDQAVQPGLWRDGGQDNTVSEDGSAKITSYEMDSYGLFTMSAPVGSTYPAPLPVSLIYFSGRFLNGNTELNWATACEQDNQYFEIERSADGNNFTPIGRVLSNGNSNFRKEYSLTDQDPLKGVSYYRLRQVDLDGTTKIFGAIAVQQEASNFRIAGLYPNPANDLATLKVENANTESLIIQLYDAVGVLKWQSKVQSSDFSSETQIPLFNLPQGNYVLKVSGSFGTEVMKLQKY